MEDAFVVKNKILDVFRDCEDLRREMADFSGDLSYRPKYDFESFLDEYKERTDEKVLDDIIKRFDVDYVDDSWQKADWAAVFIAGGIGILLDILITQTPLLKPLDLRIASFMGSGGVADIRHTLDAFSNSFRNGSSAPIDFQGFPMHGPNSLHEQYSFGHDPLRFVEGVLQIMSGDYRGVDKFGNIISTKFGQGIPDLFQAVISYIAHMVSDLCNKTSLPYPGTTLLMQFGSQKTRKIIALAYHRYGKELYNARNFIYQGLPCLFISIIIHGWAIYDTYVQTGKINLLIGDNMKYRSMLLAGNAMVMTSNLSIVAVRAVITKNPHLLFKINYPVILNTIKHAIQYFVLTAKKDRATSKEIDSMLERHGPVARKTVSEYEASIEKEYQAFLKSDRGGNE